MDLDTKFNFKILGPIRLDHNDKALSAWTLLEGGQDFRKIVITHIAIDYEFVILESSRTGHVKVFLLIIAP